MDESFSILYCDKYKSIFVIKDIVLAVIVQVPRLIVETSLPSCHKWWT